MLRQLWFAWLVFVVYGSLLPFDFQPRPLDAALAAFRAIPFLTLGVESRADWVANGVLYLPVGLLGMLALGGARAGPAALRPAPALAAIALGLLLAAGVEFAQLFFPPRTVSQNDLIAEAIGTVLGVLLAPLVRPALARGLALWAAWDRRRLLWLLQTYLAGALLLALFPFDLLLSAPEWRDKLQSPLVGAVLAPVSQERGPLLLALLSAVELALAVPTGWLLAASRVRPGPVWWPAAALGTGWGLITELLQLTLASGVSQGLSVLTRAAGAAIGAWAQQQAQRRQVADWAVVLRPWLRAAMAPYLLLLLAAQGLFSHGHPEPALVPGHWQALRWQPFYYHYYTTEAQALFSLTSVWLMYLPVAVFAWSARLSPRAAGLLAAGLCALVELAKLPFEGLHADPTNLLIAGFGVAVPLRLLPAVLALRGTALPVVAAAPMATARAGESSAADAMLADGALAAPAEPPAVVDLGGAWAWAWAWRGAALAVLLAAATIAWGLPRWGAAVLGLTLLLALATAWRPAAAWVALPALLPVLDLAPWTGRTGLAEIDAVMLAGLAGALWHRASAAPPPAQRGWRAWWLPALPFALAALWALVRAGGAGGAGGAGLGGWAGAGGLVAPPGAGQGLLIARGAAWALQMAGIGALVGLAPRAAAACWAAGLALGLAGTAGMVLWERHAFVGLLDFADVYRVSGLSSAMNVGGVALDVQLLAGLLGALALLATPRLAPLGRGLAALVLLAGCHALFVTYSRHAYAALALGLLICALASLNPSQAGWRRRALWLLVAALAAVAGPALRGGFAAERLAAVGSDARVRLAHWQDALDMRPAELLPRWLGEGLGSYPAAHYWRSAEAARVGAVRVMAGEAAHPLRLGPGAVVYVERFVAARPGQRVEVDLRWRSAAAARVGVAVCEKWLMTSRRCAAGKTSDRPADGTGWRDATLHLDDADWQAGRSPWRPVKLSLYHAGGLGWVDVASVALRVDGVPQPLPNADFSSGLDEWYFSADSDMPWHVHSTPVQLLFETGWLGLAGLALVYGVALVRTARASVRGDAQAPFLLAGLLALGVTGSLNTLTDEPRMVCVLTTLLGFSLALGRRTPDAQPGPHTTSPRP